MHSQDVKAITTRLCEYQNLTQVQIVVEHFYRRPMNWKPLDENFTLAPSSLHADRNHIPEKHHHSPSTCCYPRHTFLPNLLFNLDRSFFYALGETALLNEDSKVLQLVLTKSRVKRTLSLEKTFISLCHWSQQDEEQLVFQWFLDGPQICS